MQAALLPDRGVVKVAGDDARRFLNGLVTNDMTKVTPADPCFAALLTPQGKIIVDFMIAEAPAEDGGGFFLDCPRALGGHACREAEFLQAARQGHLRGLVGSSWCDGNLEWQRRQRIWFELPRPTAPQVGPAHHASTAPCGGSGGRSRRNFGGR
jgi:hypothetical protein